MLQILQTNISNQFMDEKYANCGFESYMPAVVIENQRLIERVELIINNSDLWGKKYYLKNIISVESFRCRGYNDSEIFYIERCRKGAVGGYGFIRK